MSSCILIIGESGTGKSTSIRTLKPDETYIIEVIEKPLPFKNKYKKTLTDKNGTKIIGNIFVGAEYSKIIKAIQHIDKERPEIKNLVIDDFQYMMAAEFMEKATEKGYQKFTELAQHTWEVIREAQYARPDLLFFFLTHSDLDQNGKYKVKTIGKLLDEKITLEGLFTVVLHALIREGQYEFLTQHDGTHVAKSPIDLFDKKLIPNDLQYVKERLDHYYGQDIPQ